MIHGTRIVDRFSDGLLAWQAGPPIGTAAAIHGVDA